MRFVKGAGPEDFRRMAVETIQNLPDARVMAYLNHLLEDVGSTSRVQHVLAFLQEIALQIDVEDFENAMTSDALQGLGWILRSCNEALQIHDDLVSAERRQEIKVAAQ